MAARRAYLDHASTSPLRPAALEAMLPFLREHFADPGRVHSEGRVTRVAIEDAREQVAAFAGARPREVVFTSSGAEAVNAAVYGALARRPGHAVVSAVEHSAVREATARWATEVGDVGVDRLGRFDPGAVADACRPDTTLVSVQVANHEVGTIQPVAETIAAVRAAAPEALVHVDARAAVGHVPFSFGALGADLASVSAHTLGGPKGVGAMLVRRGLRVPPLLLGGAQERARRAGLENVPAIVGFGAAVAEIDVEVESERARALITRAATVLDVVPGTERFGDPSPEGGLANLLCFGVVGVEAEPILLALDQRGVAIHSGSACSSETLEPSPVLEAMGVDAQHSLRVSVGWSTTTDDVEQLVSTLPDVVDHFRALRDQHHGHNAST